MAVLIEVARSRCKSMTLRWKCCQIPVIYGRGRKFLAQLKCDSARPMFRLLYLLGGIDGRLHPGAGSERFLLERGHRAARLVHVGPGWRKAEHHATGAARHRRRVQLPAPFELERWPGRCRAEARHGLVRTQL